MFERHFLGKTLKSDQFHFTLCVFFLGHCVALTYVLVMLGSVLLIPFFGSVPCKLGGWCFLCAEFHVMKQDDKTWSHHVTLPGQCLHLWNVPREKPLSMVDNLFVCGLSTELSVHWEELQAPP